MKKRTAFIGAILSLLPLGQPLLFKSSVLLSASGIILSFPEKANARDAAFYIIRGEKKLKSNNYYGAIKDFSRAIEIDPYNGLAYDYRGLSKWNIQDLEGALYDFNKAIEIEPYNGAPYNNRGMVLNAMGDSYLACQDFKKAVSLGLEFTKRWFYSKDGKWCRDI